MGIRSRGLTVAALVVLVAATVSGTPGVGAASPFPTRITLPPVDEAQYYQLVSDRYVVRRTLHSPVLAVLELSTGRQLWQADLNVGRVQLLRAAGDVLVVSGSPFVDAEHEVVRAGQDEAVAVQLDSGRELWRHAGTVLEHGVDAVVVLWCSGCDRDTVGLDPRTGQELWRTGAARMFAFADGAPQWQITDDGTLSALDPATGAVSVVGTQPAGYHVSEVTDDYVLALPAATGGIYSDVSVLDRHTLLPIATLPVTSGQRFPPELQLCGALICQRDGVDFTVYDQHGEQRYSRPQFSFGQVIHRGGESIVLGIQSRSGTVTPGIPMQTYQFLAADTGRVLSDIGVWRPIRTDRDRLWVGQFASRGPAQLVFGAAASAREPALFGYVDLRPGSPLTVTGVGPLGGAYESCDFDFGWLLCTNTVTGARPVAIRFAGAPGS